MWSNKVHNLDMLLSRQIGMRVAVISPPHKDLGEGSGFQALPLLLLCPLLPFFGDGGDWQACLSAHITSPQGVTQCSLRSHCQGRQRLRDRRLGLWAEGRLPLHGGRWNFQPGPGRGPQSAAERRRTARRPSGTFPSPYFLHRPGLSPRSLGRPGRGGLRGLTCRGALCCCSSPPRCCWASDG